MLMLGAFILTFAMGLDEPAQRGDETPISGAEQAALNALERLGFQYNREAERDLPHGTALAYRPKHTAPAQRLTAKQLEPLKRLGRVRILNLACAPIEDETVKLLENMAELRQLWLSATPTTDKGLQVLKALRKLEVVGWRRAVPLYYAAFMHGWLRGTR